MKKISKAKVERLAKNIYAFIGYLDMEMEVPSDPQRCKRILHAITSLEMHVDQFCHFELDYGFKKIVNLKSRVKI